VTSQGVQLTLGQEAQTLVDIEEKNAQKMLNIVREALIESEGILPSDAEVEAVLARIKAGKTDMPPKDKQQ
jgi:hypothetical protein